MNKTTDSSDNNPKGRVILQTLGGVGLLAVAGGLMLLIFSTEPEAVRETATRKTAMLVGVEPAQKGNYRPVIEVMGTVVPAREVMLRPRVEGELIRMSPDFVPGRVIPAGEVLAEIDDADYGIALRLRESELHRAEADLALEKGRREVARQDFERMEGDLTPENRALVLREPQFRTAEAAVEAASAAVEGARLDLSRTRISAPFNAKILERSVNLGSQVSPQSVMAHLVDVDRFWIEATVPLRVLNRLEFPSGPEEQGVEVGVKNETAWPSGTSRTGYLEQLIGSLEPRTRMARVLIEVPDPLQLEQEEPPARLLLGSFVRLDIPVRQLQNVVRLNRDHVHSGDKVWVMSEENMLEIREVTVEFRDQTYAYIRGGLEAGERVVTTQLATVAEGAALRTGDQTESGGTEGDS